MATLLTFGQFADSELEVIREAARTTSLHVEQSANLSEAAKWLDANEASAILLRGDDDDSLSLAVHARSKKQYGLLPIIGVDPNPGDLNFANGLNWGIDDMVSTRDSWPLVARLRSVIGAHAVPIDTQRGSAVVAEAEEGRRYAIARALRSAGFEVHLVESEQELTNSFQDRTVGLYVFSNQYSDDPAALIEWARDEGNLARCIISADPQHYLELSEQFSGHESARVMNSTSPPENVIFLTNELANPQAVNKRSAPRELYSTLVRFRPAGQEDDDFGFTYNVSFEGVYVRTLAPPSRDDIWLELTAPRSTRKVRLEGRIAWRRPYGPNQHATVPPGFGVKLTDGSRADIRLWREGCGSPLAAVSMKSRRQIA